jgi:hypothetical protein
MSAIQNTFDYTIANQLPTTTAASPLKLVMFAPMSSKRHETSRGCRSLERGFSDWSRRPAWKNCRR